VGVEELDQLCKPAVALTIASGSGYDSPLVKHFCAKFVCPAEKMFTQKQPNSVAKPLSSGGALVVLPWLRFHIPLIGRVEDRRAGRPVDGATFPVPSTSHAWIVPIDGAVIPPPDSTSWIMLSQPNSGRLGWRLLPSF
jgi:hypothetical protein